MTTAQVTSKNPATQARTNGLVGSFVHLMTQMGAEEEQIIYRRNCTNHIN